MTAGFSLNLQLASDTAFICDLALSRVLLMNDARFPWIVLVPRRAGLTEFHELEENDRNLLASEVSHASRIVKSWSNMGHGCEKMNIAMIGNLVRQFHVHVVARTKTDAVWPSAVWGKGQPQPYDADALAAAVAMLAQAFNAIERATDLSAPPRSRRQRRRAFIHEEGQ